LTSDEILGIQGLPRDLLVIGGGYIGCELAAIFAAFGSRVTLVEQQPVLLGNSDREAATLLTESLQAQGVTVHLDTAIQKLSSVDDGVSARLAGQDQITLDKALVAIGRIPNSDGLGLEQLGVELADAADGRLLGATVVGEQAANLVAEVALGTGQGMSAAGRGQLIHTHPTLSEMIKEAADDVVGRALHRPPKNQK